MADTFKEKWDRLDVLVNNAGAFFNARISTDHGVEMTLLVNHLAPFLLTNLLLTPIHKAPAGRIINVSSEAHRQGNMDFEDLAFESGYSGMRAYGRSKLANILFSYELTRHLGSSSITVNALHPGHVASDIWQTSFPRIGRLLKWVMGLVAISPKEGAQNSIYLASSPQVSGISGKYYIKLEAVSSSKLSYDETTARKLWDISQELVGRYIPLSK
jgi:NAD(P)-dependent dehydrogenase (short-subunit alcohol dehydrogenase family)